MPKITAARTWQGAELPYPITISDDSAHAAPVLLGWSIRAKDSDGVQVDFRDGTAGGQVLASVAIAAGASSTVTLPFPVRTTSGSVYCKMKASGKIAAGVLYTA